MVRSERLTPERRRELTRVALLDAAAVVFAERGYHAASLDAVAEAAGFSKGAIYSNFAGKEDLFFALVEHQDRLQLDEISRLLADTTGDDLEDLLRRIAEALAEFLHRDEHLLLLELEFRLYAQRSDEARRRLAEHQRAHLAQVCRFVVSAADSTGIALRIPAQELSALMVAASTGIALLASADPDAGHERLYARLLALLTDAVVASAGP